MSLNLVPFCSGDAVLTLLQAKNIKTVVDVLNQFRANDIPTAIKSLDVDQQDVLMKYLYAALAKPEQFNPGMLLNWHEKVTLHGMCKQFARLNTNVLLQLTEVTGPGSIVRVMSDKRTVF